MIRLGAHDHTVCNETRAAGGETAAPLNLHKTDSTASERLQHVRGAKLRHGPARLCGREHDRSTGRNGDLDAINSQSDIWAISRRRACVDTIAKFPQLGP